MIDLQKTSGLPLTLDEQTGTIAFPKDMAQMEPQGRNLRQMRPFLRSDDPQREDTPCYHSYRDVRYLRDTGILQDQNIRYDLTVTLPGKIGGEFMKTAGHYHNYKENTNYLYTEVYEVVHGEALFLMQKADRPEAPLSGVTIEEVLLIRARAGEALLIPSHYGHLTINPGSVPLVVSNLISTESRNVYERYEEARGGAYYVTGIDRAEPVCLANPAFARLPGLRYFGSPAEAGLGVEGPIYTRFMQDPAAFRHLNHPELA